ncbi:MAG: glycine cleavage system aminomethyltransferase GcvT [Deltaproteobacteria bacterium]|nr:glycine cleavage system aminomethyltransferase GcvT [Deltaproteobacteria bacterium]
MAKKTALYDEHVKLKGKMVEFGGWDMPVQYSGLADEHETCRTKVGLFDVSHMGEVRVRGRDSLAFLNRLVTNNVEKIQDSQAQYTVMCFEEGGCVDDLIIHRMGPEDFFICVNASNTEKDYEWIKNHSPKGVSVENVSPEYTQIAIQGRHAQPILQKFTDTPLADIKYYWFRQGRVLDKEAIIARTGYTGEDGFEIYVPWHSGPAIWSALMDEGQKHGIKPCGLGARDTLRTEMKYPLYGHEIEKDLNPLEAGLGWVVKLDKPGFIGKKALVALKESGLRRSLVGLRSLGKAIPRQGYVVETAGTPVGVVTSGTLSPCLKYGIAIAYVDRNLNAIGTKLDVVVREQRVPHEIVETPFYKRPY